MHGRFGSDPGVREAAGTDERERSYLGNRPLPGHTMNEAGRKARVCRSHTRRRDRPHTRNDEQLREREVLGVKRCEQRASRKDGRRRSTRYGTEVGWSKRVRRK